MACVTPRVRALLEELMATGNYEFQSDFAKKYVALGREEGREEGEAKGLRSALFALLRQRDIEPQGEAAERIAATRDPLVLERWILRAPTATTIDDVFGD